MNGFGERLKEARGRESQASFAKKLGISQVAYSRYELGQREPGLDCLYQIGIITGVSTDWLLGIPEAKRTAVRFARKPTETAPATASLTSGGDCSRCQLLAAHIREITGRR